MFLEKYKEVYKELYRYAYFALGHQQDAEDAVSEAVVDAYAAREKLRDKDAFRGWIFTILYRKCKGKRRKYAQDKTIPLDEALTDDGKMFTDILSDDKISVSDRTEIRQMLFSLTAQDRRIVGLHIICGYTSEEIGRLLGISAGTIRSREHRALARLRKEWMDQDHIKE